LPVQIVKDIVREGGDCTTKKCKLDNGLDGFINNKNCTESFFKTLKQGIVVNAKITNIEYDKFSVSLECKKEELKEDEALDWIPEYYRSYF